MHKSKGLLPKQFHNFLELNKSLTLRFLYHLDKKKCLCGSFVHLSFELLSDSEIFKPPIQFFTFQFLHLSHSHLVVKS